MAEDLDLDRVIRDPAYRRRVIERLNNATDDNLAPPETAGDSTPATGSAADRGLRRFGATG